MYVTFLIFLLMLLFLVRLPRPSSFVLISAVSLRLVIDFYGESSNGNTTANKKKQSYYTFSFNFPFSRVSRVQHMKPTCQTNNITVPGNVAAKMACR